MPMSGIRLFSIFNNKHILMNNTQRCTKRNRHPRNHPSITHPSALPLKYDVTIGDEEEGKASGMFQYNYM